MRSSLAQRHHEGWNPSFSLGASTGVAGVAEVRSFTATNSLPSAVTIIASNLPFGEMDTEWICAPWKKLSSVGTAAPDVTAAADRIAASASDRCSLICVIPHPPYARAS